MRNSIGSKLLLALSATLLMFSSLTRADSQHCDNIDLIEEVEWLSSDPFMEIDYPGSIAALPAQYQTEANKLMQTLIKLEDSLGDELSLEDEVRLEVLERRLDEMFYNAKVDYVEIDLLAALSDADQLKAFKLWREIGRLETTDETLLESKLTELDNLLYRNQEA
ncbi:hypothetical protein MIB92_15480 [Aestuariirhabdus sp. Z084]|uniref:hypothetical protein n=1 Tax=Aestuariirhabdus haliotis TaxID=2918751 RepID=UPI00201B3EB3|nr:hypothetical protein [Aestuariirhabdus haliotis]MCL6417062.1 hypothetical protein [Aestuariirhabdus haliotis]MCL6420973.1 hypothetical protein [Aestuariirhabdus haliotis]